MVPPAGDLEFDGASDFARIDFNCDRSIRPFDHNTSTPGSVTVHQRLGADLIYVVSSRLQQANRRLDFLDSADVNDRPLPSGLMQTWEYSSKRMRRQPGR